MSRAANLIDFAVSFLDWIRNGQYGDGEAAGDLAPAAVTSNSNRPTAELATAVETWINDNGEERPWLDQTARAAAGRTETLEVYINKRATSGGFPIGNDSNDGSTDQLPVLTFPRALDLARQAREGQVHIHVRSGDNSSTLQYTDIPFLHLHNKQVIFSTYGQEDGDTVARNTTFLDFRTKDLGATHDAVLETGAIHIFGETSWVQFHDISIYCPGNTDGTHGAALASSNGAKVLLQNVQVLSGTPTNLGICALIVVGGGSALSLDDCYLSAATGATPGLGVYLSSGGRACALGDQTTFQYMDVGWTDYIDDVSAFGSAGGSLYVVTALSYLTVTTQLSWRGGVTYGVAGHIVDSNVVHV